jgi:hypothetical protein
MAFLSAQEFSSAVEYNDFIVAEQHKVAEKNLRYITESVHNGDVNFVEQKRQEVLAQIQDSYNKVNAITPFNGDTKLKGEALDILKQYQQAFSLDFSDALKLKKDSESSYDAMEKYFKAEDKAYKKLDEATDQFQKAQKGFAERNKLKIHSSEETDALEKQMKTVGEVNAYSRQMFLVIFRISKLESAFMDAVKAEKGKAADNARQDLTDGCDAAFEQMKTIGSFKGDRSYWEKTHELVRLAKTMSVKQLPAIVKAISNKDKLTQQDIDDYNAAIEVYNTQYIPAYNELNQVSADFLIKYIPNEGAHSD